MGTDFRVIDYVKFSTHITTAGDDAQVLIWDIGSNQSQVPGSTTVTEPILTYHAGEEITSNLWPTSNPEWIFISFGKKAQLLKV